jgi:hypothetical protein
MHETEVNLLIILNYKSKFRWEKVVIWQKILNVGSNLRCYEFLTKISNRMEIYALEILIPQVQHVSWE